MSNLSHNQTRLCIFNVWHWTIFSVKLGPNVISFIEGFILTSHAPSEQASGCVLVTLFQDLWVCWVRSASPGVPLVATSLLSPFLCTWAMHWCFPWNVPPFLWCPVLPTGESLELIGVHIEIQLFVTSATWTAADSSGELCLIPWELRVLPGSVPASLVKGRLCWMLGV